MWVVTSHLYHYPISHPLSQKLKLTHSSIRHFPLQTKPELRSESTENDEIKFWDKKCSYHELESLLKHILSITMKCFLHTLSNGV